MIHKTFFTLLAVLLVGGVLFGRNAVSYLKTMCGSVSQSVEASVPVSFQIDRARQMAADLAPEVRRSMHVIATEEVELERLAEQIDRAEKTAAQQQEEILRLQADLSTGENRFRYASREYTRDEVTTDLGRRFARFKVDDETLAHLRKMYEARSRNLHAARQKLTAMVSAQKKLQTDIANLEAKSKLVDVAQASSDIVINDSHLARTKQLITDIRTRLDVAARLASVDVAHEGEIPLDETQSDDITEQVAAYFNLNTPQIELEVASVSHSQE